MLPRGLALHYTKIPASFCIYDVIRVKGACRETNSVIVEQLFTDVSDLLVFMGKNTLDKNLFFRCPLTTNTVGPGQTPRIMPGADHGVLFISYNFVKGFLAITLL